MFRLRVPGRGLWLLVVCWLNPVFCMKSMLNEPLPFSFVRMKTTLFAAWTALCLGAAALPAAEEIKPIETIELPKSLDFGELACG